ncbi:Detected protein of unknown function [Hibiscus syriacus]|uniref:FAF domain-containing protein n=1 Tax=Hibiscus syriacus TaxID=106335 RepID=A0A6A3BIB5_HIBSY|nr:uncharacterized protein LOC120215558 [Hibiscus syriacus]KAE8716353.1 Detected protein of unknown function [Hibiscus syriacus]
MQTQKSLPEIQLKLEALTICTKKTHTENHSKPCMMMAPSVLVSPTSSSLIGDYIGMESCFDLGNIEYSYGSDDGRIDCIHDKVEQRCCTKKKDIPPPKPYRMPWVLKRYYTVDGRLIIRRERVGFNEYLQAHRSNGRLVLDLVPFDYINNDFDDYDDREAGANEEDDRVDVFHNKNDHDKDEENNNNNLVETLHKENEMAVNEESIVKCPTAETPLENGITANGGKCLKYNSVRASPSCFLGLPVPAIRPVHT